MDGRMDLSAGSASYHHSRVRYGRAESSWGGATAAGGGRERGQMGGRGEEETSDK